MDRKRIGDGNFYFYHLAPKDADVMKKGLLAPYALVKENPEICNKALGHYRRRMTGGWNIYPGRNPDGLTLDELLVGLNKFRGKDGDKCIYFFRYPPTKSLGPNMAEILKGKEIYRINLDDPELQKHILFINWGYVGSNTDNPQVDEKYYRTVTEKEYFKDYRDNPKPGVPPFAPIIHIGVAFRDGICPAKFITKISSKGVSESMSEPVTEGVFDIFKKKTYTDDQLLKENDKYAKMVKRDGKAYWQTHGVPIKEKIFSTSPEPTTPEMRESMVKKAIETFQDSLKKVPQKEFHKAVRPYKPPVDEIKEWVENGVSLTLAYWGLWKFTKSARTDADGDIYFWSIMQALLNDVNIRLGNRSFRVRQDGDWDDGVIVLTDRNIVTEETTSIPCIDTERYEPIDENVKYLDFHPDIKDVEQNVYFIQDNDGINNAVYEIDGEKYRVRVETFVLKKAPGEPTQVFYQEQKKGNHYGTTYKIPGGSIEEGKTFAEQAESECNEEVRCKVKNVKFTGIVYTNKYDPETIPEWHKRILWPIGLKYVGAISFVYTAEYDGPYRKHVNDHDTDSLGELGDWHTLDELNKLIADVHKEIALERAGQNSVTENGEVVTESIGDMNSHDWMLHQAVSMLYRAAKELNVEAGVYTSDSYNREWSEYKTEKVKVGSIHGYTEMEHKALGERLSDMFIARNGRLHEGYYIMSVPKGLYTYFYIATPSTKIPEDVKRAFKIFETARRETPEGRRFYLVINDDYTISRHRSFRDGRFGTPPLQEAYKQALVIANSYKEFEFSYDGEFINFKPVNKETTSEAYKGDDIGIVMESVDGSTLFVAMESTGEGHRDFPQVVTESNQDGWPPRTYFLEITDENVKEYKKEYSSLSHVRTGKDYHGRIIFTKMNGKPQILGFINVRKSDGMIQALEVHPEFRGHGYADDLLGLAEYLGAKQLTVNVKNELAHKVYLKNGWKDVGVSGQMQLMRKEPLEFAMESVTHSDAVYEFFRLYNTPWQLMNGLRKVGARWPNAKEIKKKHMTSSGVRIIWPEEIVAGSTAICQDYAIFEHYWAEFYHFEYKMLSVFGYPTELVEGDSNYQGWVCSGHALGAVKFQGKWYLMDYHARDIASIQKRYKKYNLKFLGQEIIGPSDNLDTLVKGYVNDFVLVVKDRIFKNVKCPIKGIHVLTEKEDFEHIFEDSYGSKSFSQGNMILTRLGYYYRDLFDFLLKRAFGTPGEIIGKFFYFTDFIYSTYDAITESVTVEEEPFEPIGPIEITAEAVKFAAFKRRYKDFDEFCDTMETPNDVHNWYVYNNIGWPTYKGTGSASEGSFHWPDEILKTKCGNCFDHAVFMYLFCYKKNIPATLMRVALHYRGAGNNEWWPLGHAITLFKTDSGWFIFNYMYPSEKSTVFGPYESKEKCANAYAKYFDTAVRAMLDQARSYQKMEVGKIQYVIFTEAQLKDLRKLYEEKSKIGRDEWALSKQGIYFPKYETKEGGKQITLSIFDKMAEKGKDSALKAWWLVDNAVRSVLQDAQNISEYGLVPVEEATKEDSLNRPTITPVSGDIVDYVLSGLSNMGLIDLKEFSSLKSGKRFMYTRCTIMKKDVPLVIFLAYCEGLTTVLRKAHIRYEFSDVRPRLLGLDAVSRGVIPFADGYIIYDKFPLENSLLINGLAVMDTKSVEYADMDTKDVYVNLFDVLYGSRILGNALDNFYDWMIDPVTAEILEDYNYPSDFVGLLLAGNRLLADNVYEDEISMKHWRLRINEQVYAEVYKRVSDAYCRYRMTSSNKTPQKISIPRDQVTKGVSMSPIIEDASELSPVIEAKKSYTVSDKGPCGTNLDKAYTMKRRCYHESMLGVMAISTSADAMVGINRELTAEPNAINARGYVEGYDNRKMNEANLFSLVEMLTPGMITEDDPIRSAMSEKQSGHMVPVANASPVLISNGAEKVLPYRTSSDFSVVAKEDGQVVEYDQKTGVVVLKYKSGKTQLINLNTKIVKNGAGGFFLPNTMKAPKLKKGYHFKKNDVLAYNDRFFSDSSAEGTRLNVGVLAKVACTSTYINFEDGDFVTEKLSKKLSTDVCMEISAIVGKNSNVDFIVKKGQQVNIGDPLIIYDNSSDDPNFNKMLDNIGKELKQEITGMGKTPIKAKYAGVIESIQIISTVESKELSPSLRKIVEGYWNEIRAQEAKYKKYEKDMISTFAFTEKAGPVDAGEDGKVMGVKVGEGVYIRFFIKYRDNLDAGDKICLLNSLIAGRAC